MPSRKEVHNTALVAEYLPCTLTCPIDDVVRDMKKGRSSKAILYNTASFLDSAWKPGPSVLNPSKLT